MRVLLIYVNGAGRRFFPIGLSTLIPFLKQRGHDVNIFDTTFYREALVEDPVKKRESIGIYKPVKNFIPIEYNKAPLLTDFKEKVKKFKPGLIGISCGSSVQYSWAIKIAKYSKDNFPNIPIIMGGVVPTISPVEVISNEFINMICIGEGELAFNELCNNLNSGKDITQIKNIWVKQDGKIYKNPVRKFIDVNKLPIPDWSPFSEQHIFGPLNGKMYKVGPVALSRGCPFSCTYCVNHKLQEVYKEHIKRKAEFYRRKSVEKYISELKYLKEKYHIEMFYVMDETFLTIDTEYLRKLAQLYKKEVGIPFFIQTNPSSVTEEKVKLLKEMGCYLSTMGIENGNPELRAEVLNRHISNEVIIRAFNLFKKYGIKASSFNMIGIPFETREDFFKTVEINRKCDPATFATSIFIPYKGTKLRQIAIDNGFFRNTNKDYYPSDYSLLNMAQFKPKEIRRLFRTFFLYCRLPKFLFPLISIAEKENKFPLYVYKLLFKSARILEKCKDYRTGRYTDFPLTDAVKSVE